MIDSFHCWTPLCDSSQTTILASLIAFFKPLANCKKNAFKLKLKTLISKKQSVTVFYDLDAKFLNSAAKLGCDCSTSLAKLINCRALLTRFFICSCVVRCGANIFAIHWPKNNEIVVLFGDALAKFCIKFLFTKFSCCVAV